MIGDGYVQFSADGLLAGAGTYHMAPDQLVRFRDAVVADRSGRKLQSAVDSGPSGRAECPCHGVAEDRARGYPKDHPRMELLRLKGLVASRSWPPAAWQSTAAAKKRVVDAFQSAAPLVAWLHTNVGSSDQPEGGRARR